MSHRPLKSASLRCYGVRLQQLPRPCGIGANETMKSQTKSVTIAAVIGLALSILGNLSGVLTLGYVSPLDRFNPFNAEILAYWIGNLGGLPVLFIVGTVMATWRKARTRNSILNGVGAIVILIIVVCTAVVSLAVFDQPNKDTPLKAASADRATFVNALIPSCVAKQQSVPQNKDVSAAAINAICTCYGNALADVTTMEEITYITEHHGPSPSMATKINAAYLKCAEVANKS